MALSQRILGPNTLVQGAIPRILKETPKHFFDKTIVTVKVNVKQTGMTVYVINKTGTVNMAITETATKKTATLKRRSIKTAKSSIIDNFETFSSEISVLDRRQRNDKFFAENSKSQSCQTNNRSAQKSTKHRTIKCSVPTLIMTYFSL
jgi:hypothetical protein